MHPAVVEKCCRRVVRSDKVNLVLPGDDGILAAPLDVFWCNLGVGAVLDETFLKIAGNDVRFTRLRVEGNKAAAWRHAQVAKGADVQKSVLAFACIDDVNGLFDAQEHFDRARKRVGRGHDSPRVDFPVWRGSQELRTRLGVRSDGDERVVV